MSFLCVCVHLALVMALLCLMDSFSVNVGRLEFGPSAGTEPQLRALSVNSK